jgi:hypothetical protein
MHGAQACFPNLTFPWNLRNADERHLYLHVSLDVRLKAPTDEPTILLCA